jgi:hypothetical protein
MVVETDLAAPDQVDLLAIGALAPAGPGWSVAHPQFPYVVAILAETHIRPFDLSVQFRRTGGSEVIVVFRSVRDVAFVAGQKRMFVLPMLAKCRCQGTACPEPGDPDCDDLRAPALAPLDARANGEPGLKIERAAL